MTKKYHHEIIACENLIFDVCYNGGGSDYVYCPFLPYICTGAVKLDGISYYLSPDNKDLFRKKGSNSPVIEQKADYSFFTPNMEEVNEVDTIYQNPLRVAIVHNEMTISSGETFVLQAKQSDRVTTYGVNTAGIIDGFNGNFMKLGCITIQYPTTLRSHQLPKGSIDPYGIAPDVFIPSFMNDPYPFILEHLESLEKP